MKKRKLLKTSSIQSGLHLNTPLLWYLGLEHFGAPSWAYGVVFTVCTLFVLVTIIEWCTSETISIEEIK